MKIARWRVGNLQELGPDAVGKALTTAVEGALMQMPGAAGKGEGPVGQAGRITGAFTAEAVRELAHGVGRPLTDAESPGP